MEKQKRMNVRVLLLFNREGNEMKFKSMKEVVSFMKQQNVLIKQRFIANAFGSVIGDWIIYSEPDGFYVTRFKKYEV